ncbi:tRNA pseudouridine(38-40) synthase TruA [Anaerotruncus colihominis]|uniref:tRNA pseudouridine(38-40) synthase TruA n=1 Tax=Anaerotruncus colihominis TaxID=169435 RepID=UPI0026730AEF|nr:tRNA pseudouridine(38-40) synthase TruA [Anaerotruncus colihominis]
MRHLLLTIRYRGTRYHGYQVQQNAVTVAQTVQDAVERVFGERLPVKGCSRTDAGVHANCFVLTLRTVSVIACDAVVRAMNVHLPDDIAVTGCREVPDDFHPRYDCKGKRYLYRIYNGAVRDPFSTDLALFWKYPLDERLMDAAAQSFVGTHDFAAFCSSGSSVQDTVRTVTDASVTRHGEFVTYSVTGNGFLYNMVRIMVGTLLEAARGVYTPADVLHMIEGRDRSAAGPTAPPHGLYLDTVFYKD